MLFRSVAFRGFDEQMVVVAHEAIGIKPPTLLADFLRQEVEEGLSVGVVEEDVFAPVTSGGEVIDSAGEFEAKGTDHGGRLARTEYKVKASYIDAANKIHCNRNVELAEPQDIGKTLGV